MRDFNPDQQLQTWFQKMLQESNNGWLAANILFWMQSIREQQQQANPLW